MCVYARAHMCAERVTFHECLAGVGNNLHGVSCSCTTCEQKDYLPLVWTIFSRISLQGIVLNDRDSSSLSRLFVVYYNKDNRSFLTDH